MSRAVPWSLTVGAVTAALSAADGDGLGPSVALGFVVAAVALAVYLLRWLWPRRRRH